MKIINFPRRTFLDSLFYFFTNKQPPSASWRDDQIEDAMAEWRTRQESRRAGVGICLCHAPGREAITPKAQMWKASGYEDPLAYDRSA
jgi:hypothetical protein